MHWIAYKSLDKYVKICGIWIMLRVKDGALAFEKGTPFYLSLLCHVCSPSQRYLIQMMLE